MKRRDALHRLCALLGGALAAPFGGSITGCRFPRARRATTLTDRSVRYTLPRQHFVELHQGSIHAVVVDNEAIDEPVLTGHRAGYNGLAALTHEKRRENLFVPAYGGLNFEFMHDGTPAARKVLFEPRNAPMELRLVDEATVELYQPPSPNWKLESCGRYHLLPDGTIEYTFECIPRERTFKNGYIGLFWANYIHEPANRAIHFKGRSASGEQDAERWIRAVSPEHGVESTHPPAGALPELAFDPQFPLSLLSNRSPYVYTRPWYYGVSHGMAYALMFRERDRLWFAQSPNGGGDRNPAWDFQWFIPDYQVGEAYGFTMRAAYFSHENRAQVVRVTRPNREALNK